jgi:hypothetical protein
MAEIPIDRYWPIARHKAGLLKAALSLLAGNSHISFEGDLSKCVFPEALQPSGDETSALRRQTLAPRQDFIVLDLSPSSIQPVLDILFTEKRYSKDIIHIQIEKDGLLQFGSYDNFHDECIVCFPPSFTPEQLEQLRGVGAIRSWSVPHVGARRWHG